MEVIQLLPAAFIERLQQLYPSQWEDILQTFQQRRPTTFRANTLKMTTAAVKEALTAAGFSITYIDWLDAFVLVEQGLRELEEHPLYQSGSIYVQGLSSMIPPRVLDPQPGDAVLDIAAAPGSKTTQMAALMQNRGMILANDTSTVRLYKLRANLEKLGVTSVQIQRGLGEHIWSRFPSVFEKTLVDVPCSMEGRFLLEKPKTYAQWSVKKIKELAQRQKHLLRSAVSATQLGGTIVYSTCTLAPEENEGVVDWILKKEAGAVQLEPCAIPQQLVAPAVMSWQGVTYNPEVAQTVRILPSQHYEGFFIAKLRKVAAT